MSLEKGVSSGQGQAEPPALLGSPQRGTRLQGLHGRQDQAPGSGQAEGKGAVCSAHACQDQAPAEQAWALRACCSRALHRLCLPVGSGTGGCRQCLPKRRGRSLWRSCCHPSLYRTAVTQPRGASPGLHPPAPCWDATQQCQPPPPQGFRPPSRSRGCFPPPSCTATPCHPHSPDGTETCQEPSAGDRRCVPQGWGSLSGWRPRAGVLG